MNLKFKQQLHQHCIQLVDIKIIDIKNSLNDIQNAANNDTKSTAGDKHETSRAMAHLEIEKLTKQLNENIKLKETLIKIDIDNSDSIKTGSLIKTNKGYFYLAISLGKLSFKNFEIYAMSPASPIGKLFLNKKEKETFSFNNTCYVIEQFF